MDTINLAIIRSLTKFNDVFAQGVTTSEVPTTVAPGVATTGSETSLGGPSNPEEFLNTPLGNTLKSFLVMVGVIVLVVSIVKAVSSVMSKKTGEGLVFLISGALVAYICFDFSVALEIVEAVGNIFQSFLETLR